MNPLNWKYAHFVLLSVTAAAAITAIVAFQRSQVSAQEAASLKSEMLKVQAHVMRLKPLAARAHELPLEIKRMRPGEGRFIVLNHSESDLPVTFHIGDRGEKFVVIPKATGWLMSQAKPGDRIEISSPGFDPVLVVAR